MNKKRDQLKRIQYDGKIDAMISLAEIEFSVEKDKVEMLSLSQRIKELKVEESKMKRDRPSKQEDSLFSMIPENKKMVLFSRSLDRKQIVAGVRMRREGAGLELISGDEPVTSGGARILEVNGQNVLRIQEVRWREMSGAMEYPAKIVLMTPDESDTFSGHKLTEDIAMIQARLNQKLREGRHVSQELAAVQAEREALTRENTCLVARVQYLEDQNESLQSGMRHVRDSLATCLNNGVLNTLHKLDTCQEKYRHVGHDSSSTSGVCSAEDGSDGSNSSQYNSWRENQGESSDVRPGETTSSNTEGANIEVWTRDSVPVPTVAALRQRLGEERVYENLKHPETRDIKLDRANSTVHRVSNLIRWPRNKFKHQERKFL